MPVISFVNSKGGSGKTTSALVLAQAFVEQGASVTLLDCDPMQPLLLWHDKNPDVVPRNLRVIGNINEQNIIDEIDAATEQSAFVFVDVEGSANRSLSYAMARSDLVVIPTRGSQLDVEQALRVMQVIEGEQKAFRREIPHSLLFTCTGMIRGKDFKFLSQELHERGIPMFDSEMMERAAFRTIMQMGGTLYDLTAQDVSGVDKAIENAETVAKELYQNIKAGEAAA